MYHDPILHRHTPKLQRLEKLGNLASHSAVDQLLYLRVGFVQECNTEPTDIQVNDPSPLQHRLASL